MADPYVPYPISGYVYDTDSSTVVSGATVTALNSTTGKELTISGRSTTNASGEYTIDLANLPSGYSDEDIVVVKVTYGSKIKEYRTTVDTDTGYEEKNLTLTYIDVLDMTKDLITDDWESARTDLITPTVGKIFDYKRLDIELSNTQKTFVLLYELPVIVEKNSVGVLTRKLTFPVTIDIRTMRDRLHLLKVRNEVDRILNSNIVNSVSGWDILDPDGNHWVDLSDKTRKLWRFVLDIKFEKLNASRTNEWWA